MEMVDSVDDLKPSCPVRGIRMPDFEVLDAKIASALNRIIHNTRFKKKITHSFSKRQTVPVKPGAKSWTDSKTTIHSVTIAWKNTSQTSSSAKSPHCEI